nr:hypothetical protein [Nitrosomonas nitrosa]
MEREIYTPGHTANAAAFMAGRTWTSHGQFFTQYLSKGQRVLSSCNHLVITGMNDSTRLFLKGKASWHINLFLP